MTTTEIIVTILGSNIVTNAINAFVTHLFTKKKYNSEVDTNVIKNMQESLDFYKKLCDDNKIRLEEVLKRNEELNMQVISLQSEILEIYKFIGVKTQEELSVLKSQIKNS